MIARWSRLCFWAEAISLAILLNAFSICTFGQTYENAQKRAADEDQIRESIFRYQMAHPPGENCEFFLRVRRGNGDPSKALMERFRDARPRVKKYSQRPRIPAGHIESIMLDPQTHRTMVILDVSEINWKKEVEAEVKGGYQCGGRCGANGLYHVALEGGIWIMKQFDLQAIL